MSFESVVYSEGQKVSMGGRLIQWELFWRFKAFRGSFKSVSMRFQECFNEVSRVFQGSFKGVSRKFKGCFKEN